jgi:hypothetical protein
MGAPPPPPIAPETVIVRVKREGFLTAYTEVMVERLSYKGVLMKKFT